jgi:hypothetical protein
MDNWKDIKINGIASIEKCVAEFQIGELQKTPFGKFKIKIFERANNTYAGFTNLMVKHSEDNSADCGVGFGSNISEALEDTLNNFMEMLNQRENWEENDFEWSHPDDF